MALKADGDPGPEGVVRLAERLVEESHAALVTTRALPLSCDAYSYPDLDSGRDVILVSLRLEPLPMRRAEAILHELGHRHSPTLLGRVGDCSPWQIGQAMSRAERYACRWAAERAVPLSSLTRLAGRLRTSYDVADLYECSHSYAQHVLALYQGLCEEDARGAPWELVRLFRRTSREAG